jgi:prepilin-type N-terminal cleavage/methylation domain-containing protein
MLLTRKTPRLLRPAFTLIELLVVIAIIVVLVAIAIPSLKILGQSNNQKQAVNLLTSLIANARAIAIQSHTQAGLVIFEDPASKNGSSGQLVIASSATIANITDFIRAPRTVAQRFPIGITLATLDNTANFFKTANNVSGTVEARIILFDESGQLVLHNGLTTDPAQIAADPNTSAWNLNGASVGVSSPGLIVYDATEVQAAKDTGKVVDDASLGNWIQQHADIIIINPYTGNVIR